MGWQLDYISLGILSVRVLKSSQIYLFWFDFHNVQEGMTIMFAEKNGT